MVAAVVLHLRQPDSFAFVSSKSPQDMQRVRDAFFMLHCKQLEAPNWSSMHIWHGYKRP